MSKRRFISFTGRAIPLLSALCVFGGGPARGQTAAEAVKSPPAETLRKLAGKNEWRPYPGNPVLTRGKKGEWDDWAVGSMSVVRVDGTFHMFYEGWGQGTIRIGHAVSADGIQWKKDPANPVLGHGPAGGWDSGATWDAFVLHEDGVFKLWYGATPSGDVGGRFHWGYAESKDGSRFERKGLISGAVANAEFEDDHVVHDAASGRYFMYYWDRNREPKGLYRAESKNETAFDFPNAKPVVIEGLSDTPMHKFTHVFQEDGKWIMYYAEFKRPRCLDCATGVAVSTDGLRWKVRNGNVLTGQDAEILKVEPDLHLMYYSPNGFFDGEGCDVRLAVLEGPPEAAGTPAK